ncbi:hypothetical protein ACOMHN_048618 [Nucella lapillus]
MGLQDTPLMSAVPAHDVIKSRGDSARSGTPSNSQGGLALEESLLALTLQGVETDQDQEGTSNLSEADDMEYQQEVMMGGEEGVYDMDEEDWDWETDESRLSRALRSWMSNYVIKPLPPQAHTLRQPVFSARLGQERSRLIPRASSTESLDTLLSLFSCSSHGSRQRRERKRRRVRRKKPVTSSADGKRRPNDSAKQSSRWVELARRRKGELDRFMRAQSHALTQGFNLTEESDAFNMCEVDEQRALYLCGQRDKMLFAAELKKSDSMTNINKEPHTTTVGGKRKQQQHQRVTSAGAKTFYGKPLDFQQLHRQVINQRLAALNTPHKSSGRRSMHRTHSRLSLASNSSGHGDHAFFSIPRSPGPGVGGGADSPTSLATASPRSTGVGEGHSAVQLTGSPPQEEKSVNMWKGDAQILAIDLNRDLTAKVKRRIAVTTSALERVTGLGDDNEQRPYTCHLPEFPSYVNEDFAHQPKIPQKIRIAPHLSDVIKSDIKVRMGRPRYHEIRVHDLDMWSRGQTLDRSHRNLKVFNWLHSLKEDEFEEASLKQTIHDVPPDLDDVTFGDMVLIRAADEPDIKPLYQQKKMYVR